MKKVILLLLLAATLLAQRGNVNWTQIRIQDPIPLPGNNPLVIKLSSGHTANGMCVQSYTGTTLFCIDKDGNINTYASGGGQVKLYGSTSGSVSVVVPAVAGTGTTFTIPATSGTALISEDTGGGSLVLYGSTSGSVTLSVPAVAGTRAPVMSVNASGSSCTITAITAGIVTAASCTP